MLFNGLLAFIWRLQVSPDTPAQPGRDSAAPLWRDAGDGSLLCGSGDRRIHHGQNREEKPRDQSHLAHQSVNQVCHFIGKLRRDGIGALDIARLPILILDVIDQHNAIDSAARRQA